MAGPRTVDRSDIQALLKSGFGDLTEAVYLLATVIDPGAARAWLADATPTSVADMAGRLAEVMQIAVSSAGLAALGLGEASLAGFSPEFLAGMTGDEARSRRLGDVGVNAPERWRWGGAKGDPHVLILLYAAPGSLGVLRDRIETAAFREAFSTTELTTTDMGGHEPFGFVDGISQPTIDWTGARTPGTNADLEYGDLIAAGEFVLGETNEYGKLTTMGDLGRNGAYLVFRQLQQDVRGFWRFVAQRQPSGGAAALAEAMVGRRLDGAPLVAGAAADPRNGFTYVADPEGLACPFGAHVRRANPRTADMPGGVGNWLSRQLRRLGLITPDERADRIAASRFHRILRRGREYGRAITPEQALDPATPDPESGLDFICLVANIARQFEFVQGAWIASAKFGGLDGEQDPLLGAREPFPVGHPTDAFSLPRAGGAARRIEALPTFVTVRGGAYFFLPGLSALKAIARS